MTKPASGFQGLRTVIYAVADLQKARAWYTQALGQEPYFAQPYYVGFNVGGFELGLDPDVSQRQGGEQRGRVLGRRETPGRPTRASSDSERARTAPVRDVGQGILVGSVVDPFGNVLGIIQNPHFKLG